MKLKWYYKWELNLGLKNTTNFHLQVLGVYQGIVVRWNTNHDWAKLADRVEWRDST